MPKKTLPPIYAPGALYVLAVAAGKLISEPLAVVLAVIATVVLFLVVASYEGVQRHLPDLGRLPFVVDHGLHTGASKRAITTSVQAPTAPVVRTAPSLIPGARVLAAAARQAEPLSQLERLKDLYYEGEQLQAHIRLSFAAIPSDVLRGTANQRQVERERLARNWDKRILDALADDARPKWSAAATLPEHKLDPASTIAGVNKFLTTKLACLKEIIDQLDEDQ